MYCQQAFCSGVLTGNDWLFNGRNCWIFPDVATASETCDAGAVALLPCPSIDLCENGGLCALDAGGWCYASTELDCAWSQDCRTLGLCKLKDGLCTTREDEKCGTTYNCMTIGRCDLVQGRCLPGDDADCEASLYCDWSGECAAWNGMCVTVGESDSDCAAQEDCKQYGLCSACMAAAWP